MGASDLEDTKMTDATPYDTRYVDNRDPGAVLVAWLGDLPMGGWLDDNEADFRRTVESEARNGIGDDVDLTAIVIRPARRNDEDDQRHVSRHDPRAVLEAWIGPQSMGGWTDSNQDAFHTSVRRDAEIRGFDVGGIKIYPADTRKPVTT